MRVTDRMLFDRAARDGGAARTRLEEAVARASTGQRLVRPGDDPAGAGLVVRHQAAAAQADSIMKAAQQASDELAVADSALNDVTNALARARELAIQLANDSYGTRERVAAAGEAQGLLDRMIGALNTRFGSRYVFGGTLDGAAPFDATGNFLGNSNPRLLEIAPGVYETASVRADRAVKGAGGGVDLLTTMRTLVSALQAGNQNAIQSTIPSLATATDQVAGERSVAGNAMAVFDAAVETNRAAHDDATAAAAHLTDADVIEANSQLALAQRALEASLTATASSFRLSLLDYLK